MNVYNDQPTSLAELREMLMQMIQDLRVRHARYEEQAEFYAAATRAEYANKFELWRTAAAEFNAMAAGTGVELIDEEIR